MLRVSQGGRHCGVFSLVFVCLCARVYVCEMCMHMGWVHVSMHVYVEA